MHKQIPAWQQKVKWILEVKSELSHRNTFVFLAFKCDSVSVNVHHLVPEETQVRPVCLGVNAKFK